MQHLFRSYHDTYRQDAFFNASAIYQTLGAARDHVPTRLALQAVKDGWVIDPNEQQDGRSLLLAFLGTFQAPSHKAPDASFSVLDDQRAGYRMAFAEPLDGNLRWRMLNNGETVPDLIDPMGPPVPSQEAEVALRLLGLGANPWAQDRDGRDALDQGFSLNWSPVWRAMLRRTDAPSVEALALRTLNVPFLTQAGAQQQRALPWLHAMAAFGREHAMGELLDLGVDVNQRDNLGRTPLFYAQMASTVQTLLERGADPLALDAEGLSAGTVWPKLVASSVQLGAMNQTLNERMKPLFEADPAARTAMHQPALYELVRNGTKDNVLKFLRSYGFTVNDRRPDGQSLLGHTALQLLESHTRSPALMMHLLDRVDDPWHVGITGVPDVALAWLATQHNQNTMAYASRQSVAKRLQERYTWATDKGYAAFMRDMDTAAQGLVAHHVSWASVVGDALANGLYRSVRGDVTPETKTEKSRTVFFAPGTWAQILDGEGQALGWRIALTMGCLEQQATKAYDPFPDSLSRGLRALIEGPQQKHRTDKPWIPYDRLAMHALLVPIGWYDSNATNRRREQTGFLRDHLFHQALQAGLAQGLDLDPSHPGFETSLAGIRKHDLTMGLTVENAALRKGLEDVLNEAPLAEARPRRRM